MDKIMTPVISVVMSVFNGERYLRQSVESILTQSFCDFEFIIVNDGSVDGTREILESFGDDRIIVVNQENLGVSKALNEGIGIAKGRYIARQDADDISKPDRLEKQLAFMEANRAVGLLGTRFEFIDENGMVTRLGTLPTDNKTLKERLPAINQFSHGSVMIRKGTLDHIGLYRDFFKYAQDYDLWLRIADHYQICNLPEYLFCYREIDEAISSSKILTQSLYAGIAAEMAVQRRQGSSDDLQSGRIPELPNVQRLSIDLQEKLVDFYTQTPHDMLRDLQVEPGSNILYLFQKICADRQRFQIEVRNKNGIIHNIDDLVRRSLAEHHDRLLDQVRKDLQMSSELLQKNALITELQKQLEQKDCEITTLDERLRQFEEEVSNSGHLLGELEKCLDQRSSELVSREDRLKQIHERFSRVKENNAELEKQLEKRDVELEEQRRRIRQLEDELTLESQRLDETLRRSGQQIAEKERQLRQDDQEIRKYQAALHAKTDEAQSLNAELLRLKQEYETLRPQYEQRFMQQEAHIADLLSSLSWRVTAPLRAGYDMVRGKK